MQDEFCFEVYDSEPIKGRTIAEQWMVFHARNPHIMDYLIVLARRVRKGTQRKLGIGMLFEILRWQYWMATETEEPYKLNNNYCAYYARAIMDAAPDLDGVFNLKKSGADELFNTNMEENNE